MAIKITCISDLHGEQPALPGGDLLIIAGDLTARDETEQWIDFFLWLKCQNYEKKVFISGNHDYQSMSQFDWHDADYLLDSGTEYKGLKIWGSPWTRKISPVYKWWAFGENIDIDLAPHFDKIPEDTDILITHSPPWGFLDSMEEGWPEDRKRINKGSRVLRLKLESLPKIKLHVFGHIHEGYGKMILKKMMSKEPDALLVNAAIMDKNYNPVNKPTEVILNRSNNFPASSPDA